MKKYPLVTLGACTLLILLVGAVWARTSQNGSVERAVIGSGGAQLEQGSVNLQNTLGQPVVGRYSDGDGDLCVGSWCRIAVEACVALEGADIDGPASAAVDSATAFTATVEPVSATLPVTYTWEAEMGDSGPTYITHTGGLSDTAAFTWSTSGPRTITVTAVSPCGVKVTSTHTVGIEERCIPLAGADVDGPTTTAVDTATAFTATVEPVSATLPVTYTWEAETGDSGPSYIAHTGGLSDTAAFTWSVSGPQTVTMTAVSPCGVEVSSSRPITVEERWAIYLPAITKELGVAE